MLQFAFNQIERASNVSREVKHNNLTKKNQLKKQVEQIEQLQQHYKNNNYQQTQQNLNSAGGAVSFGSKLFIFVNSDIPDIDVKDKDNFYKTDSFAEKIGNKSYVIDMGSDKANVFVNNIQLLKRKTSKKSELLLPNSVINLSKAFDGSNAEFLFNELKNKVTNIKFNRYVVVNFGMFKNIRVLLSKSIIDLTLSVSSSTPSTFSPVNFNADLNQKTPVSLSLTESSSENLSNFIKQSPSQSPSQSPVPIPIKSNITSNSISQTSSAIPVKSTNSLSNTSASNNNLSNSQTSYAIPVKSTNSLSNTSASNNNLSNSQTSSAIPVKSTNSLSNTSTSYGNLSNSQTSSVIPVSNKPVSSTQVSNKPVSSTQVSNKPVSNKPVSNKPVSNKPVSSTPVSNKPVSNKQVSNKPVSNKPVSSTPAKTNVNKVDNFRYSLISLN